MGRGAELGNLGDAKITGQTSGFFREGLLQIPSRVLSYGPGIQHVKHHAVISVFLGKTSMQAPSINKPPRSDVILVVRVVCQGFTRLDHNCPL